LNGTVVGGCVRHLFVAPIQSDYRAMAARNAYLKKWQPSMSEENKKLFLRLDENDWKDVKQFVASDTFSVDELIAWVKTTPLRRPGLKQMAIRKPYLKKWLHSSNDSTRQGFMLLSELAWDDFLNAFEPEHDPATAMRWWRLMVWHLRMSLYKRRRRVLAEFTLDTRQEEAILNLEGPGIHPSLTENFLRDSLVYKDKNALQRELSRGPLIESFARALNLLDVEESSDVAASLRKFWTQSTEHNSLAESLSYCFIYFTLMKVYTPKFPTQEMHEDPDLDMTDPAIASRYATEATFENFIAAWAEQDVYELLTYVYFPSLPYGLQNFVKRAIVSQLLVARYPREALKPRHREATRWCHTTTAEDVFDYWFTPDAQFTSSFTKLLERMIALAKQPEIWSEVLAAETSGRRRFRYVAYDAGKTWIPFRHGNKMLLFQEDSAGAGAYAAMVNRLRQDSTLFDAMVTSVYTIDEENPAVQRVLDEVDGSWALLPQALDGQRRPANMKKTVNL